MEQRTLDWYRARLGKITGSQVGKLIGKDDKFTKTAMSYIFEVAAERMLSPLMVYDDAEFDKYIYQNNFVSREMQWGIDNEENARFEYEDATNNFVQACGSIQHPELPCFASSPDGLVGEDGIVEIKCPSPATFARYSMIETAEDLLSENAIYYWQCMAHMAVTGRKWVDFVVYHPLLIAKLHITRVERDESAIERLLSHVKRANDEIINITAGALCIDDYESIKQ